MIVKQWLTVVTSCIILGCASSTNPSNGGQGSAKRSGNDCIFQSSVRGYSVLDESNLIIDGPGRRRYHVALQMRAMGISSSWGIGFASRTDRVCAGFSEIVFNGHLDGQSIRISSITLLTAEEYDDLLVQFGKKEPEIKQAPAPIAVKGAEVEELDPAAADDSSGN